MRSIYREDVYGDEGDIARYVEVESDDTFIHIITDHYEGHAMISLSTAKKLLPALQRAIAHTESLAVPTATNRDDGNSTADR